jgi:hypothetical protein
LVPRGDPRGAAEAERLCEAFLCTGADAASFLALSALRRELSTRRDPAIREVIDAGVPGKLAALLRDRSVPAHVHREAVLTLAKLCEGASEEVASVVSSGAAGALVGLLSSAGLQQRPELCSETLATLSGLASDPDTTIRDHLLQVGVIEALDGLYGAMQEASWSQAQRLEVLRALTRLARTLCSGIPSPPIEEVDCMFDYFFQVVNESEDPDMRGDAISGLQHLLRSSDGAGGGHLLEQLLAAGSPEELRGLAAKAHHTQAHELPRLPGAGTPGCVELGASRFDENCPGAGNSGASHPALGKGSTTGLCGSPRVGGG